MCKKSNATCEVKNVTEASEKFTIMDWKNVVIAISVIIIANLIALFILPEFSKEDQKPNCKYGSLHKDAKSAISRAESEECKRELFEIACKSQMETLYPSQILSQCSLDLEKSYLGCFKDSFKERIYNFKINHEENSPDKCIQSCGESGYSYAGLQYSKECFCGNIPPDVSLAIPEDKCDRKCPGDPLNNCGGYLAMNVYHLKLKYEKQGQDLKKVRVAYLFIVHGRSLRQIMRHLKWLYNPHDYFFFHVDSRSSYLYRSIKELEQKSPNNIKVTDDNRFATIWGGASLLTMILACLKEMVGLGWEMDFVINISESDYLLKRPEEFKQFLAVNEGKNFVKSHGRDIATFVKKQGLDRTFHQCDNHMYRLGPRTLPNGLKLDGGSDWVCLSRAFIDYLVMNDHQHLLKGLLAVFNYTLLPAESFFHTALKNSPFCSSYTNNNLRVTNWKRQLGCQCQHKAVVDWCGCSPNVFTEDDWRKIAASQTRQVFFARKFDAKISQTVINQIDQWIFGVEEADDKYWENIYHFKDDSSTDNPILDLAKILIDAEDVKEVYAFFVQDNLDSLLVQNAESEFRFKVKERSIKSKMGDDTLTMGHNFDVKERIFRGLVQAVGVHQTPQLLIQSDNVDQEKSSKEAWVWWVSPWGKLLSASNVTINITLGHHLLNFPSKANLEAGLWTAVYIDNHQMTEVEFVVLGEHQGKSSHVKEESFNFLESEFEAIRQKKTTENHHSLDKVKAWIVSSAYELAGVCQVSASCLATNWSSRSPDPKSTIEL